MTISIDISDEALQLAADGLEHAQTKESVYEAGENGADDTLVSEAEYETDEDALRRYLVGVVKDRVLTTKRNQLTADAETEISTVTSQVQ